MASINVFVLSVLVALNVANCEKIVTCYYGTWATYRPGLGKFDVSNINPDLCTHVIYAFAGITQKGAVVSLDAYLDLPDNWGRDNFRQFTNLKLKNPKLKTLLAIGGWNEGSYKYSVMAASPNLRQAFISSALNMVSKFNFDGIDIDWEYPNRRDTVYGKADVTNFSILLKEMKHVFDKYGYLLTAAVSSVRDSASLSYDIPTISKYLDFIHIMAYDMYGSWDPVTGHNAGLHKGEGDDGVDRQNLYTVDVALEYWLGQGAPPEKLVLGVPFYGRTFTLRNADANSVRSPANGAGIAGPYTATKGLIGYNEFCKKLQTESWTVRYDKQAKVPHAFLDRNWVSYDNPDSIKSKVEYGMKHNIAGIMVWSIETDDFNNVCGGGDFPLLRAINEVLNDFNSSTTEGPTSTTFATISPTTSTTERTSEPTSLSTEASTVSSTTVLSTTSTLRTTTAVSNSSVTTEPSAICKEEGYTADPTDCSCFYICVKDVSGSYTPVKFKCPDSLYWDKNLCVCNYPYLTECNV